MEPSFFETQVARRCCAQVSFRSYWTRVLLDALRNVKGDISIKEISDATMIRGQDIVDTLQVCVGLGLGVHVHACLHECVCVWVVRACVSGSG
eukprot:1160927-Pelagomonas_calceolata.AAC.3